MVIVMLGLLVVVLCDFGDAGLLGYCCWFSYCLKLCVYLLF